MIVPVPKEKLLKLLISVGSTVVVALAAKIIELHENHNKTG